MRDQDQQGHQPLGVSRQHIGHVVLLRDTLARRTGSSQGLSMRRRQEQAAALHVRL